MMMGLVLRGGWSPIEGNMIDVPFHVSGMTMGQELVPSSSESSTVIGLICRAGPESPPNARPLDPGAASDIFTQWRSGPKVTEGNTVKRTVQKEGAIYLHCLKWACEPKQKRKGAMFLSITFGWR